MPWISSPGRPPRTPHHARRAPDPGPRTPVPDRVLVTAADLEHAVRINAALEGAGFQTALATSLDDVRAELRRRDPDCLVLTGGLHESSAGPLLALARERAVSTLGLVETTEPDAKALARALGLTAHLA